MVECGWSHDHLMAMSEGEFCFWLDERGEYDRLIKEAATEQTKRAKESET